MTLEQAQGELVGIASARHVHFDVWPEVVVLARHRRTVGFEVRDISARLAVLGITER